MSLFIHLFHLDGIPHIQDEIAYLFQAMVFLEGRFFAQPPPMKETFFYWFIENGEKLYGIFPPGWSLLLAAGMILHIEKILNPLLLGILPFVLQRIEKNIYPEHARCISPLLVPLSPILLLLSSTFMSHTLTLLLYCSILLLLLEKKEKGRAKRLFLSGMLSGGLLITRPQDFLFACLPLLLFFTLREPKGFFKKTFLLCSAGLPFLFFLLLYNSILTGSPLLFPQNLYFSKSPSKYVNQGEDYRFSEGCNNLGFGEEKGCRRTYGSFGHTFEKGIQNGIENFKSMNKNLFGFPLSLLLPLFGIVLSHKRKSVIPVLIPIATIPIFYSFYWAHGICYGPRFFSLMIPSLILLSTPLFNVEGRSFSTLLRFAIFITLFISQVFYYYPAVSSELKGYWCVDRKIERFVEERGIHNAVLLCYFKDEEKRYSLTAPPIHCGHLLKIGSAFRLNDPWFDGDIIYGHLLPERGYYREMKRYFPERDILLYIEDRKEGEKEVRFSLYRFHTEEDRVILLERGIVTP